MAPSPRSEVSTGSGNQRRLVMRGNFSAFSAASFLPISHFCTFVGGRKGASFSCEKREVFCLSSVQLIHKSRGRGSYSTFFARTRTWKTPSMTHENCQRRRRRHEEHRGRQRRSPFGIKPRGGSAMIRVSFPIFENKMIAIHL